MYIRTYTYIVHVHVMYSLIWTGFAPCFVTHAWDRFKGRFMHQLVDHVGSSDAADFGWRLSYQHMCTLHRCPCSQIRILAIERVPSKSHFSEFFSSHQCHFILLYMHLYIMHTFHSAQHIHTYIHVRIYSYHSPDINLCTYI